MVNDDWIVYWNMKISEIIAVAWVLGNPLVIWIGYYMRDRSKDEENGT